jgi:hypothetical protein
VTVIYENILNNKCYGMDSGMGSGGDDFLPTDAGGNSKNVNLTVGQLIGKFDGEPNPRADT